MKHGGREHNNFPARRGGAVISTGRGDKSGTVSKDEASKDERGQPWLDPRRPAGALPPQDCNFCIEDDGAAATIESLLSSLTVSDPSLKGNPLVFASSGFETLTGYGCEEVRGVNCKVLQAGMKSRAFTSVEITNYKRDGRAFQNLLCIMPVLDAYDNLHRFVGVQCDLEEARRRREVADEHFATRWQEQVHHYLNAFMLLDCSDDSMPFTMVSPGFASLTGYSQPDLVGCSCVSLAGPGTSTSTLRKWVQAQWAAKPIAVKLLLYRKDGSPFWAYIFSCPLVPPPPPPSSAAAASAGPPAGGSPTPPPAHHALCVVADITSTRCKRVGKYQLGRVIGSGAFGIVRVARAQGCDDVVAVKTVDAAKFRSISEIEQIQEEMSVLSSLQHPHIIRLIEIHFINSVFFLVMEFAAGGSLVKHVSSFPDRCLPEEEAQRVFQQVVSALDYCHRRRVIHRDLKPENILMDENANVKIADFGLAAVTAPFSGKGLTQQCGTPEFAAPEVASGKEYSGPCADIWSLGVVLYEMLTGHLPFHGSSFASLLKATQRGSYAPLPSHLSQDCHSLVRGLLRVDPKARLTMHEILDHPWVRGSTGIEDLPALEEDDDEEVLAGDGVVDDAPSIGSRQSGDGGGDDDALDDGTADARHEAAAPRSFSARPSFGADCVDVSGRPSRRAVTGAEGHDSLRIVLDEADTDDPISAAILRAQLAAMSNISAGSGGSAEDRAMLVGMGPGRSRLYSVADDADSATGSLSGSKAGSIGKSSKNAVPSRDLTPSRVLRGLDGSASPSAPRMTGAHVRRNSCMAGIGASGSTTSAPQLPPLPQPSTTGTTPTRQDRRRGGTDGEGGNRGSGVGSMTTDNEMQQMQQAGRQGLSAGSGGSTPVKAPTGAVRGALDTSSGSGRPALPKIGAQGRLAR